MTVTAVEKDPDALSMTITTAFDAPIEQVWRVWSDPRLLERWWGPPTYPATVVDHDLSPGGTIKYYMTGPEGDRHGGWWRSHLGRRTACARVRGRLLRRERPTQRRHANGDQPRATQRLAQRRHPDVDPVQVPVARGDGTDDHDGHGRRIHRRHRPDRRAARDPVGVGPSRPVVRRRRPRRATITDGSASGRCRSGDAESRRTR